jgi:hypothetical protein
MPSLPEQQAEVSFPERLPCSSKKSSENYNSLGHSPATNKKSNEDLYELIEHPEFCDINPEQVPVQEIPSPIQECFTEENSTFV